MFSPCLEGFPLGAQVSSQLKNMHVSHISVVWPNVAARSVTAAQEQPSTLTSQFLLYNSLYNDSKAALSFTFTFPIQERYGLI